VLPPERQAEFHVAHALATDTNDLGVLHPLLRLLGERLGRRLRRQGLVARRLRVALTYADHTASARAVPPHAAALDSELWDAARRAFTRANARRLAVRVVALTLDGLETAESQLDLWEVEAASDQPAGERPPTDVSEPDDPGAGAGRPGRSTACWCGGPPSLLRLPGHDDQTDASAATPHDARGLQDAIDRIRGRWGARGVVPGSGLALSGSRRRDATTPAPS